MQDAYSEISKEQFEKMIQLYNPCMDDYLYVYDLQNDYYRISEHATERFCLPGDSFEDAAAKHRQFVDANDIEMLIKEINEIKTQNNNLKNEIQVAEKKEKRYYPLDTFGAFS